MRNPFNFRTYKALNNPSFEHSCVDMPSFITTMLIDDINQAVYIRFKMTDAGDYPIFCIDYNDKHLLTFISENLTNKEKKYGR